MKMPKKLSYDYVKSYFEQNGCTLISTEYINNYTPLEYTCSCGATSTISFDAFRRGQRCRKCGNKKISKSKIKLTLDEVKEIFKSQGCTLLSNEYLGIDYAMEYICVCGNKSKIRLADFRRGVRCKVCQKKKMRNMRLGSRNPAWKEEKLHIERQKDRSLDIYRTWRYRIFQRDNYTCQICNQRGNKLQAHHLESFASNKELRIALNNGITLCKSCHKKFHDSYGKKNNNIEQFQEFCKSHKIKISLPSPRQITFNDIRFGLVQEKRR